RAAWIGAHRAKQRARRLANPVEGKVYRGLAVLTPAEIREAGAGLKDSRDNFRGHADVKMGIRVTKGEPPPAKDLKVLRARQKQLASTSRYHIDPRPESRAWKGPDLM